MGMADLLARPGATNEELEAIRKLLEQYPSVTPYTGIGYRGNRSLINPPSWLGKITGGIDKGVQQVNDFVKSLINNNVPIDKINSAVKDWIDSKLPVQAASDELKRLIDSKLPIQAASDELKRLIDSKLPVQAASDKLKGWIDTGISKIAPGLLTAPRTPATPIVPKISEIDTADEIRRKKAEALKWNEDWKKLSEEYGTKELYPSVPPQQRIPSATVPGAIIPEETLITPPQSAIPPKTAEELFPVTEAPTDMWIPQPPVRPDYEAEMKKIAGKAPKTVEDLLGPKPKAPRMGLLGEMLREMAYAYTYGGPEGALKHRDYLQKKIDDEYYKNLDIAMAGATEERQAEYSILKDKLQTYETQARGYESFLTNLGERHPDIFVKNPAAMRALMQAYHLDKESADKYLEKARRPDGTYNLGWTEADRTNYKFQTMAHIVKKFNPNMPDDAVAELVITNKFPEWAQKMGDYFERSMTTAMMNKDEATLKSLVKDYKAYKSILKDTALDTYVDKMTLFQTNVLPQLIDKEKKGQVEPGTSQRAYVAAQLAYSGLEQAINDVLNPPGGKTKEPKEPTFSEQMKWKYEYGPRYTGINGIFRRGFPETETDETGIATATAMKNVKAAMDNMQAKKKLKPEEQQTINAFVLGAMDYVVRGERIYGRAEREYKFDAKGEPRAELIKAIQDKVAPWDWPLIVNWVDSGLTNADILQRVQGTYSLPKTK